MPYGILLILILTMFQGCAGLNEALGIDKFDVPPEFNQEIILRVSDEYQMHQAPRSGYDAGDLQAFHTQHTLPVVIEDAFKEMFGKVVLKTMEEEAQIETDIPEVPAIFEVRILDLAHDIYSEAEYYRAQALLGVAMKSPRGNIFWQKAFRGDGYAEADPQWSTGLGPQDAVIDAMRDAILQMQEAIVASPQVRAQMKHYWDIEKARRETEMKI